MNHLRTIQTACLGWIIAAASLAAAETKPPTEPPILKETPDKIQQVGAKDGRVAKNEKIDKNDEETSVANDIQTISVKRQSDGISEERIKIVSKTFIPPTGWLFALFPEPTWYGTLTHVDIFRDLAVYGFRIKDTDLEIKIKGYFVLTDAADFPLRGEGNLKRPETTGGGRSATGGTSTYASNDGAHWSAKVSVIELDIRTDFNRDRKIDWNDDRDKSTKEKPFRFWINDDLDYGDADDGESYYDIVGGSSGLFGQTRNNYIGGGKAEPEIIDGNKDLLDFMPVAIRIKNLDETKKIAEGRALSFRIRCKENEPAFKLSWWDYDPMKSGDFQIKMLTTGFAATLKEAAEFAHVYPVTKEGLVIPAEPLKRLLATGQLMFICEGGIPTKMPIEFVAYLDNIEATRAELPISTSTPEEMYRWINVRGGQTMGSTEEYGYKDGSITKETTHKATNTSPPPNFPDYYLKDEFLVFAHGFRTNEIEGRGNCAEMFKRFFWSGANTKFIGVAWFGDNGSLNYYRNEQNSILSSTRAHAALIAVAPAAKTHFTAHSLGNMLLSSIIQDHGYIPKSYAMFNSALSQETLTESGTPSQTIVGNYDDNFINTVMVHPNWRKYERDIRANEWYRLFAANDSRNKLSWRGRFKNDAMVTDLINYYSSADEVLANWDDLNATNDNLLKLGLAYRKHVWYSGQINMGRWYISQIFAQASRAGWDFRGFWDKPGFPANDADKKSMRIETVFNDFRYHSLIVDKKNKDGKIIAGNIDDDWKRATTLCESIPATTFAVGSNACEDIKQNGMPVFSGGVVDLSNKVNGRPKINAGGHDKAVLHSSILYIAYLMAFPVIDDAVDRMKLK